MLAYQVAMGPDCSWSLYQLSCLRDDAGNHKRCHRSAYTGTSHSACVAAAHFDEEEMELTATFAIGCGYANACDSYFGSLVFVFGGLSNRCNIVSNADTVPVP